jgi:hypothetical protein
LTTEHNEAQVVTPPVRSRIAASILNGESTLSNQHVRRQIGRSEYYGRLDAVEDMEMAVDLEGQFLFDFDKAAAKDAPRASDIRDRCPECSTELRFESGCVHCPRCGYSNCPLGDMPE